MPGQVQGIRKKRASLRPSPSFAKSGSVRPKRQLTSSAGLEETQRQSKVLDKLKQLNIGKDFQKNVKVTEVLTIQSFIERSKNNELV